MEAKHLTIVAYGLHVLVHGNPNMIKILDEYDDVISYSSSLSLLEKGTVFVYLKSKYQEQYGHPVNLASSTDDCGTKHCNYEYVHSRDMESKSPVLTEREHDAINKVLNLCYCNPKMLMWVHHSNIISTR